MIKYMRCSFLGAIMALLCTHCWGMDPVSIEIKLSSPKNIVRSGETLAFKVEIVNKSSEDICIVPYYDEKPIMWHDKDVNIIDTIVVPGDRSGFTFIIPPVTCLRSKMRDSYSLKSWIEYPYRVRLEQIEDGKIFAIRRRDERLLKEFINKYPINSVFPFYDEVSLVPGKYSFCYTVGYLTRSDYDKYINDIEAYDQDWWPRTNYLSKKIVLVESNIITIDIDPVDFVR